MATSGGDDHRPEQLQVLAGVTPHHHQVGHGQAEHHDRPRDQHAADQLLDHDPEPADRLEDEKRERAVLHLVAERTRRQHQNGERQERRDHQLDEDPVAQEGSWSIPVRLNEVDQAEHERDQREADHDPYGLALEKLPDRQRGDGEVLPNRVHGYRRHPPAISPPDTRTPTEVTRLRPGPPGGGRSPLSPGRAGLRRNHARRSSPPRCGSRLRL